MHERAVVVCLSFAVSACGTTPTVEKIPVTLDQCTSYLAATACDRYSDCQGHNDVGGFASREQCEKDYKQRAARLWPSDVCDGARVDEVRFENCLSELLRQTCTKDPWDVVKIPECQPSYVCSASSPDGEPVDPQPTN